MALTDRELLAKTLQAEAGNQGLQGMLAVGSVIRNRMGQGGSLSDVILAPAQFSAWNKVTGAVGGEQGQDMAALKPSEDAYAAADAILSGNALDVTGGATHYYNPSISNPAWGKEKAGGDWTKIGAHIFGKAGDFRTGAAKMNGEQTQKPQGLLGGLLGGQGIGGALGMSDDFRDKLKMAILAGTGDARMAPLIQATQAQMQERKSMRDVNKTVDWLRQNVSEEVAQAVANNPGIASNVMSSVLAQKISPPSAQGKVVTADQLRALYPGQQIADGLYNLTEGPEGMRISKVGGAGSQTTIQMPGQPPAEDELRKKLMGRKGEDFGRYLDAGTAAGQAMTDLRILQELAPLAPSGPVTGRLAEAFPGFAGNVTQLRQSIITRVAPTLRVEGSGATSDLEFNAMLNSLGSLVNTPEANQAIISVMMAKQQYNLDRANIVRQYEIQNISLEEANNQLAALEGQSRIPAQVQVILDSYKTEDAPVTSAPKVRDYNPETGEFE
jgi:hypothetical protein